MDRSRLNSAAMLAFAAATLAGCGAPAASSLPPQSSPASSVLVRLKAAGSWMSPTAASQDLLYVSDSRGVVYVYSYPSGKLQGELRGFQSPGGLCSDPAGNVFVVNTNALDVLEYKHGGTQPTQELNDFGHYPFGCAVDPKTENVAVANYASTLKLGPGSVSIFDGGKGVPHSYQDSAFNAYFFCGYDDKSNLFVDGADYGSYHTLLAEIPAGKSTFTNIAPDQTIGYPGGVQWDGTYLTVGDSSADELYRFKVSGKKATSVGKTSFKGDRSDLIVQYWIDGSSIIVPYGTLPRDVRKVGFWSYPGGGSPTPTLDVPRASELIGVTVSVAKKK